MYYIFNIDGNCIASCDGKPNMDDLATRNETAQESTVLFDITQIYLVDGEILVKTEQA